MKRLFVVCMALLAIIPCGCALGPKAVEATHGRYAEALLRVDEEQLLRNIVRLRYSESPRNIDVSNIAAQYEMNYSGGYNPFFSTESVGGALQTSTATLPSFSIGGSNRPTITYRPDDDGMAIRRLLTPANTETLLYFIQSGWQLSTVLRLWVDQLNGVPNGTRISGPGAGQIVDSGRFNRAVDLLQAAADAQMIVTKFEKRYEEIGGGIPKESITAAANIEAVKNGLEYAPRGDGRLWGLVRPERQIVLEIVPGTEKHPIFTELSSILNLKPGLSRYEIDTVKNGVTDPAVRSSEPAKVLKWNTRSPLQVYYFLTNAVAVPPEHLAAGLVPKTAQEDSNPQLTAGLLQVQSCCGKKRPENAYIAIEYRGYWYYIVDSDLTSKTTFMLMLQMWRLDLKRDIPGGGGAPALTLTVGR
ncbi:MAG: hypothetical protein R3B84_09635 [Zavarzinella sp.]